jgi:predicted transposase YbfD/YdcC
MPSHDFRALAERFATVDDPRLDRRKRHQLLDIIVVSICATIAGADSWVDVERFGQAKLTWFRTFLSLPNGIPSHDTIGRVFALLDPEAFHECFRVWMAEACALLGLSQVAVDGKTMRGSGGPAASPLHVVSAFAVANGITLGQRVTDEKSNEITAIPQLLAVLDLAGAIVTIDALGCQTKIAAQIRDGQADYLLAVKENQERLYQDIERLATVALEKDFADVDFQATVERSHGRGEYRGCYVLTDLSTLRDRQRWRDVASIVVVISEREVAGKAGCDVRYYISSRVASAAWFAQVVRGHWGVENGLHWLLGSCGKVIYRHPRGSATT